MSMSMYILLFIIICIVRSSIMKNIDSYMNNELTILPLPILTEEQYNEQVAHKKLIDQASLDFSSFQKVERTLFEISNNIEDNYNNLDHIIETENCLIVNLLRIIRDQEEIKSELLKKIIEMSIKIIKISENRLITISFYELLKYLFYTKKVEMIDILNYLKDIVNYLDMCISSYRLDNSSIYFLNLLDECSEMIKESEFVKKLVLIMQICRNDSSEVISVKANQLISKLDPVGKLLI